MTDRGRPEEYEGVEMLRYGHTAMACRFEIVALGRDRQYMVDAAEEAFRAVDRVEDELSAYRAASEISRINALAATQSVRVSPPLFRLIERAIWLSALTDGAFDITLGPLIRLWGFFEGHGQKPGQEEIEQTLKLTGRDRVRLNPEDRSIRFDREGVEINPGGFGKGYAVDCAAETLLECGLREALVHAGTSTVRGAGTGPVGEGWRVGIRHPRRAGERWSEVTLSNESLSTSGDYEQFFEGAGRRFGHVLDPRTGWPAEGTVSASVVTASAADSDALSTAAMVLGQKSFESLDFGGLPVQAVFITQGDIDERESDYPA